MRIAGHLDRCGPELTEGWLYADTAYGEPMTLQVYVGDRLIGECTADRFRPDLQQAGYGDGRCSFSFPIPQDVSVGDFAQTRLRFVGSPVYLLPSEDTVVAEMA